MKTRKSCSNAKLATGTRAQVWHGTACHTSGGLLKKDLILNKHGRIVSRKKHHSEKKNIVSRLFKKGYKPFKGRFGVSKGRGDYGSRSSLKSYHSKKHPTSRSRSRSRKGGGPGTNYPLNPSPVSGLSGSESSVNVQFAAGMGGRRRKHKRGGFSMRSAISPAGIDGQGITNYGKDNNNVQFAAGMAA
jgi:hypothetical protein